jgi:hypothetical protein
MCVFGVDKKSLLVSLYNGTASSCYKTIVYSGYKPENSQIVTMLISSDYLGTGDLM